MPMINQRVTFTQCKRHGHDKGALHIIAFIAAVNYAPITFNTPLGKNQKQKFK